MDLQLVENGALEIGPQLQGAKVWGKTRRSFESRSVRLAGRVGERFAGGGGTEESGGEGTAVGAASDPAPGWQHFGRPHTIETKYQFKTISKLIFSAFVPVCSLAVYEF